MDGLQRERDRTAWQLAAADEPFGCCFGTRCASRVVVVDRSQFDETHVTRVPWRTEIDVSRGRCIKRIPNVVLEPFPISHGLLSFAFGRRNKKRRCGPIPQRCEQARKRDGNQRPKSETDIGKAFSFPLKLSWSERPAVCCGEARLGLRGGPNQSRAARWGQAQRQRAGAPGQALLLGCLPVVSGKRLWAGLALPVPVLHARMPSRAQPAISPQSTQRMNLISSSGLASHSRQPTHPAPSLAPRLRHRRH